MATGNENLKIPQRILTDNFKLQDYKDDFTYLNQMILTNLTKPIRIEFRGQDFMLFYVNGARIDYQYAKDPMTGKITKITNITENRVIDIVWS